MVAYKKSRNLVIRLTLQICFKYYKICIFMCAINIVYVFSIDLMLNMHPLLKLKEHIYSTLKKVTNVFLLLQLNILKC